uniref:Ras-associating domain-containing protein n=1 Tax=Panagrolaimus superbus TaxID=310955 RepID=A0A914Z9M0_9BILA
MLKYQVRATPAKASLAAVGASPSTSQHRTIISIGANDTIRASTTSLCSSSNSSFASNHSSTNHRYFRTRSNSISSLSSLESSDFADWGHLRIFTGNIKAEIDFKTLKVSTQTSVQQIIEILLSKFRLTCRDPNLYQLWMEVCTRNGSEEVKTLLELDPTSRPLELQRCHPSNQSRFILHQASNGILVRIHDNEICPESNYKSLLISPRTTVIEVIQLVLQIARIHSSTINYRLMLVDENAEAEIPSELVLAAVYLNLSKTQKIVIRK